MLCVCWENWREQEWKKRREIVREIVRENVREKKLEEEDESQFGVSGAILSRPLGQGGAGK